MQRLRIFCNLDSIVNGLIDIIVVASESLERAFIIIVDIVQHFQVFKCFKCVIVSPDKEFVMPVCVACALLSRIFAWRLPRLLNVFSSWFHSSISIYGDNKFVGDTDFK
jgi:hypothetical protein